MAGTSRVEMEIRLSDVNISDEEYNCTEFVFGRVRSEFEDSFSFGIGTLHEALFGELVILFYARFGKNKRLVGTIKQQVKFLLGTRPEVKLFSDMTRRHELATDKKDADGAANKEKRSAESLIRVLSDSADEGVCGNDEEHRNALVLVNPRETSASVESRTIERVVKVLPPSFLHKANFFKQELHAIGEATLSATTLTAECPAAELETGLPVSRNILDFFVLEDKTRIYKILLDLFFETQKGTMLCKIHWIFGLLSADYFYSFLYNVCSGKECGDCPKEHCRKSYRPITKDVAREAMQALQYSAAAFGNSFLVWRIRKVREMPMIQNKRLRAILERLEIDPKDFFLDKHGGGVSLSFIAFFERERMVVSFKGTTSGSEAIHDLKCEYVDFQDGYAHNGILNLSDRFIEENWPELRAEMARRNVRKVLFTGHSLGAAASVLTYLRLQEKGIDEVLNVRVIGFGAPPIVSRSIAKREQPNIHLFLFGSDIITRLCFGSVLDLKYVCISISSLYDYFTDKLSVIKKTKDIKLYLKENEIYPKLYHVGNLHHIRDFKDEKDTRIYLVRECRPEFFEDIFSVKRAPLDHFLSATYWALEWALKDTEGKR